MDMILKQETKFFLDTLFGEALKAGCGEIELRIRSGDNFKSHFFSDTEEAAICAHEHRDKGCEVYVGVNPRIGGHGKKENVHYVIAFHADIDYGTVGHKKQSQHATREAAHESINSFLISPSILVDSGGGFHCYWLLTSPIKIEAEGLYTIQNIELINKQIIELLGGDAGTHDISKPLRLPGTLNLKVSDKPRKVTVICNTGSSYAFEEFMKFIPSPNRIQLNTAPLTKFASPATHDSNYPFEIEQLPISARIKHLIMNGKDGSFTSRSEADMAVINALVKGCMPDIEIKKIFRTYAIGEKYREHGDPDQYLEHTIRAAQERLKTNPTLNDNESVDPLFLSGALYSNNNRVQMSIVKFQEFIVAKHKIIKIGDVFYRYTGRCYELCKEDAINYICQKELAYYRELFKPTVLREFMHYAVGQVRMNEQVVAEHHTNYLTLKNGLFSLKDERLIPHTSEIFTTNELPYDYDPDASCPRFLQYLHEVFPCDIDILNFIQQAVGYSFHKGLPVPLLVFLIGPGANGKSVFTDLLYDLFGEKNTSNISLNKLSDEIYLSELYGKMVNISAETPQKRTINTDIVKAVVAGDTVVAKCLYKNPFRFQPFAKHFLAMNAEPQIDDDSHGMFRRMHMVHFQRVFTKDEMDVQLREKLKLELSGIFNWALEGYQKLRTNGFILPETQLMMQHKDQYRNDQNSVLAFASQAFVKTEDCRLPLKRVYEAYVNFCNDEGIKFPEKKNSFRKVLERAGYRIESSTKDANQVIVFDVELV